MDLREWNVRVLDIQEGIEDDHTPLCLGGRGALLSRKLFENVNSLFANESEFVIIGMHLARQLYTGKVAWASRSGSFQEVQSAGGNGGSSLSTTPVWTPLLPEK